MKKNTPVYYHVNLNLRSLTLAGFLDMLRYDQARVRTWTHASRDADGNYFVIYLESPNCTVERWKSFGFDPVIEP